MFLSSISQSIMTNTVILEGTGMQKKVGLSPYYREKTFLRKTQLRRAVSVIIVSFKRSFVELTK